MLVHIVFWRLYARASGGTKDDHALELKRRFESLVGVVPGLLRCEVGIDEGRTPESSDLALYSEFESKQALDAYASHPAHSDIVTFLEGRRSERRVVDYQIARS